MKPAGVVEQCFRFTDRSRQVRCVALGARLALELEDDLRQWTADADHPAHAARHEEGRQPVELGHAPMRQATQAGHVGEDVVAGAELRELGDGGRGAVEGACGRGMAPGSQVKAVPRTNGSELERQGKLQVTGG